jgi:hypothetical protein
MWREHAQRFVWFFYALVSVYNYITAPSDYKWIHGICLWAVVIYLIADRYWQIRRNEG